MVHMCKMIISPGIFFSIFKNSGFPGRRELMQKEKVDIDGGKSAQISNLAKKTVI